MRCRILLMVSALTVASVLGGCARGSGPGVIPEVVLEIVWEMAGPVNDSFYYYVAFDADDDEGADFPVPVAAGPYWGNGWGTGSITHFLEYHAGAYQLYRADLNVVPRLFSGGFLDVLGDVTGGDAGEYTITVSAITLGAVTLTGTGAISAVTNDSDQNAGMLELETDAAGSTVAGSVSFTPAADGGRPLDAAEQAQINTLNGGVPLQSDSLDELGLTLTVSAGTAGTQVIEIAPAVADVDVAFKSASTGQVTTDTATVTANSSQSTADPPIAGVDFVTGDVTIGAQAQVGLEVATTGTPIGPPFEYVLPNGSNTLRATVDLANLGVNVNSLDINFITTTELIFDPNITDPNEHTYDGLGPWGNDAIRTFNPNEFFPISNDDAFPPEESDDSTLVGPATEQQRAAVDIVDWQITPHRLL